jgi:UDP-N-acetylglucosamine 4,6-dehydratase
VDFVLQNFGRMQGGELFVPKIPSMRITDLCESIAPGTPLKVIGIRPGEKLHEVMCPADESHLTLEFTDHYVIRPSITFYDAVDFSVNKLGEVGVPVEQGFEYSSVKNPCFLTVEQLRSMNGDEHLGQKDLTEEAH